MGWLFKKCCFNGDVENGSLMAGQSVSMVKEVQPVSKIFDDLLSQIDEQLFTERKNNSA